MPTKTIYVSDEDLALYRRAQTLAGGNLSAAVTRGLRRFVEAEDCCRSGFEEVRIRVGTGRVRNVKRFMGVLLAEWRQRPEDGHSQVFRIYRTPKEHYVVHVRSSPGWSGSDAYAQSSESMEVADSLQSLKERVPPALFEMASANAVQPAVEDLDL